MNRAMRSLGALSVIAITEAVFVACGTESNEAGPGPTSPVEASAEGSVSPIEGGESGDGRNDAGDSAVVSEEAGADAGGDPPTDAAAESEAAAPICQTLTLGSLRTIFPTQGDTTGASVAYEGCAKTATATGGVSGSWSLKISQEASWYRVSRAGWRTTLSTEIPAGVNNGTPVGLQLVGATLTGYEAAKAQLLLSIVAASGGCTKNGNTLAIVGHPEAVVHYVDVSGNDVGSSTNTDGFVWMTNIDPAVGSVATLAVTPAVTGCLLIGDNGPTTGKVPLVADTVTALSTRIDK